MAATSKALSFLTIAAALAAHTAAYGQITGGGDRRNVSAFFDSQPELLRHVRCGVEV